MAGKFKNRKFFLAFSSVFKKQSAWDTPVSQSDIDKRHPQVTPTIPSNQITREETRDCGGEYIIREEITSKLKRLRFGFYASAQLLTGWLALAMGAVAAPTGTPADEVQTITVDATGGTFTISLNFEGLSETTAALAYNANAAAVQAALEGLRPIKSGNATCSGSLSTGMSVTFTGALAKADIPLLTTNAAGLTGGAGTATVVQATAGANKLHAISRSTADQPPQTTLIYGFEGDATAPTKLKNVVVNSVRVSASARGRVLVEVDLVGSGDVLEALAYSVPACVNFSPIKAADCRLKINGSYYGEDLREFSYEYNNNILTGDDAFPFDDIDAVRLERGDRTSSFAFTVFGSKGDTLYTLAASEPIEDVELAIGRKGDRVTIFAPAAKLRLRDDELVFVGEANRSAMQIDAVPFFDAGVAGSPDYAEAMIAQTDSFLST